MIEHIAADRAQSLSDLEAVIERGMETFVEVGSALLTIRDDRLYRETHGTFEDYCRGRWGLSRTRSYELIDAARVAIEMSGMPDIAPPANARQATELARIPDPETRADVWHRAVEELGESVTAADVRRIATEYRPQPDPPLLAVVDVRTGEIVDTPDIVDVAYEISDPSGKAELDRLRYLKRLSDSLKAVSQLASLYDPADVAAYADDTTLLVIDAATRSAREWAERIKAVHPSPLQVITGGRA